MASMTIGRTRGYALAWVAVWVCGLLLSAAADEIADQARQIVAQWQDTVVTVRLVIKTTMSFGGMEGGVEENKVNATGTIVDPSGLVVVSLSETDPSETFQRLMSASEAADTKFKMESKVTDLKLRFADGKEVPAKVVLRDKDLDLAFVRPEQKLPQPIPALDLGQSAAPQLLDEVVALGRLSEVGDWTIAAGVDRIQAVLEKPRRMYVPEGSLQSMGAPVFASDGRVVGITVLRAVPSARGVSFTSAMGDLGMLPVILPAADILEVAKQAPAE